MSIKVLVADDSITIQKVIGIIFGGDEYSLTVVDNGKAAVDKAREIIPDILLIDALMPGMSGYEAAEMVRATPSLATKPILILTGSFEPFDEEKAKKCGADDFIAKPFESQQVINKVKELLELASSRAQSAQAPQPQPVAETVSEEIPEVSMPAFDVAPPVVDKQPEAASDDIWGAFTSADEPPVEAVAAPFVETSTPEVAPVATIETDVFAIVSEENDAQLVQSANPVDTSLQQQTGSQWVPVEENTFEFEEEIFSSEPPRGDVAEQAVPVQEPSFGDIAFEDEVAAPEAPALADLTAPAPEFEAFTVPTEPFAPLADPATPELAAPVEFEAAPVEFESAPVEFEPAPTAFEDAPVAFETSPVEFEAAPVEFAAAPVEPAAPAEPAAAPATAVALTEEQLRAALASASKDVIERIVWEVVPDLAEAMIREAIRKIKEGV